MKQLKLVEQYLNQKHMMQLATVSDNQPWCCTVYYVHDAACNLYWASVPSRRHSQEIAQHSPVAIAIPVQHTKGEPVVGIQMSGSAELLEPSPELRQIALMYAKKFGRDQSWVEDFISGKTEHRLYKFVPTEIILFDEVNFAGDPRQSCTPTPVVMD